MSKQSKMTGADYLLLLLYLDNCSAINGAIRITKMMFLFNMEIAPVLKKKGVSIRDEDLPKFSAYNYGPFSKDNRTEKCPVCGHEKTAHGASMQPELITPTMMKSLSNQLYTNLWSSAAQELRDATHIIFVGYSLPIADFEFRYMLQKNVTSSAKIDVILTPNSNPDLVANNLKDLLPSKRYLDAFPKNKVSFYYEGFGPYFSLSK